MTTQNSVRNSGVSNWSRERKIANSRQSLLPTRVDVSPWRHQSGKLMQRSTLPI
jgi:hypothetical protein